MPVSATAIVIQSRPSFRCGWAAMVTVPFSVNLLALLARLSSACRTRVWSAWIVPSSGRQSTDDAIAVLRCHRLDRLGHVLDQGHQRERFEVKFHAPGLDLRQVENVVDQGEQVRPAPSTRSSGSRSFSVPNRGILAQHLGEPMMALSGVRSSWLILARNCDLCWLASASCRLLSWISSNSRTFSIAITAWSAKVVDQLDLLVGERPHRLALQQR